MGFLANVQISCFVLSYLVAISAEFSRLRLPEPHTGPRFLRNGFLLAGLLAQTLYLVNRSRISGLPPLVASTHDWLLVLAWILSASLLIMVLLRDSDIGYFLLPAVLLCCLVSFFVGKSAGGDVNGVREIAAARWTMLHATTLALGMIAVAGAVVAAAMFLVQHHRLRGRLKRFSRFRLPSLETLSFWNRSFVIASVPLLAVGLLTGFILTQSLPAASDRTAFHWTDPVVIFSGLLWGVMLGVMVRILGRKIQTGKEVALLSLLSGSMMLTTIAGLFMLSDGGAVDSFHSPRPEASATVPQEERGA